MLGTFYSLYACLHQMWKFHHQACLKLQICKVLQELKRNPHAQRIQMQRTLFTKFGCEICAAVVKMHKGQS